MAAGSVEAVQVGAKEYIGESTFEIIAHAFDSLVDFDGGVKFSNCIGKNYWFFFMVGKSERA